MATSTVTIPGTPLPQNHHRVTILLGSERLTMPISAEEVPHDNWAPQYAQTPRPGQAPILDRVAPQLETFTLNVIFQLPGLYRPVDGGIATLKRFANADDPVIVSYGFFEAGFWWITGLRMVSKRRREDTNELVRAELAITFTSPQPKPYRKPPTRGPGPKTPATPAAAKPVAKPKPTSKPTRYTVQAGDTLSRIAGRLLGDANRWPEIASLNKIKDPRKIRPGQVLTIPAR